MRRRSEMVECIRATGGFETTRSVCSRRPRRSIGSSTCSGTASATMLGDDARGLRDAGGHAAERAHAAHAGRVRHRRRVVHPRRAAARRDRAGRSAADRVSAGRLGGRRNARHEHDRDGLGGAQPRGRHADVRLRWREHAGGVSRERAPRERRRRTARAGTASPDGVAGAHIRVLYTTDYASAWWTRASVDGRFVGHGAASTPHLRFIDLLRGVVIGGNALVRPVVLPGRERLRRAGRRRRACARRAC